MIRALPHIRAYVFNVPLLIERTRAEALVAGLCAAMLARGSAIEPMAFDQDEGAGQAQQSQRPRGYRIERGIAMLPVRGVLVRRAGQMSPDSTPLQSYEGIRNSLRAARSDNRVRGILMELDTPGGEAGGVFELAREVRAATKDKPVWAIANDDALSAGYAIGAAAQRLWITETGAAGSIGVVALHLDQSEFDAKEGFKYSYIFRGERKIDANPHAPLSAAATGAIQGEVDRLYGMLIDNVAEHRAMSPDRLRDTRAALYFGGDAVKEGLADQLGTLDRAHAAMAEHTAPVMQRRAAAQSTRRGTQMEDIETTAAEATGENVVHFDRGAAVAEGRSEAGEIAGLCALAGYPELAAEQIASGASLSAVRQFLQQRKAADAAKLQVEAIDTTAAKQTTIAAELNAAATARFAAQRSAHRA